MSADILEYVDQKVRDSASSSTEWSILYADDWANLRAEIVRLRGEVDFHRLDAGALRVQLDSCIERLEVQTKNALHLHAMMVDAEARAEQAIAPAEANGGVCPACRGAGGHRWHEPDGSMGGEKCEACDGFGHTPQPADGGAVAPFGYEHGGHFWFAADAASWVKHRATKLYTHPPAAQVQGEAYQPIRFGGIRRPSDEALAAAFWEHRQRENSVPADLCDPKLVKFGNDIVQRARELAPHLAAHPSACELGAVRELVADWRTHADTLTDDDLGASVRHTMHALANELEAALQHRGDSRGGEG